MSPGIRDSVSPANVADARTDVWPEVGICTELEEVGEEGLVAGCIA